MDFAALRQHVTAQTSLSTDWFAEDVTWATRDGTTSTKTVKIEYESKPRGGDGGQRNTLAQTQADNDERIRVVVSTDATFAGGYIDAVPDIGTKVTRAAARDSDERPFVFTGQVIARGEYSLTLLFQRARRVYDGRR